MPPLSPKQRRLRAQIAANTRWSKEDPAANAARGQAGLQTSFEKQVDPDGTLTPAERTRRAEAARKAHMQRLALASARSRSARSASRGVRNAAS
jgi:hypothetical protein